MKIEILYKEVCNLYGDYYNHIYLITKELNLFLQHFYLYSLD